MLVLAVLLYSLFGSFLIRETQETRRAFLRGLALSQRPLRLEALAHVINVISGGQFKRTGA